MRTDPEKLNMWARKEQVSEMSEPRVEKKKLKLKEKDVFQHKP